MKTITDTLQVSRSHQYARKGAAGTKRRKHSPKEEDVVHLPLIRQIIDRKQAYEYRRVTAITKRLLRREGKPNIILMSSVFPYAQSLITGCTIFGGFFRYSLFSFISFIIS